MVGKEWDEISRVFFQRYIAYLPEISKTGATVRMSERSDVFIINVGTTKQSDCSKYKKVCLL